MKILIAYGTKYGTTRKAAEEIAKRLPGEVDIVDLKQEDPDVCVYDVILIGASVYGGNIQKEVKVFLDKHKRNLIVRPYGLFIAAGNDLEVERNYRVYVGKTIYDHANIHEYVGYSYDFSKMNIFEKIIIKKMAKVSKSTERLEEKGLDNIVQWVRELENSHSEQSADNSKEE